MTETNDTRPGMTERHWELLAEVRRQIEARRFDGRAYPQAVAPWDRPEYQDRSAA